MEKKKSETKEMSVYEKVALTVSNYYTAEEIAVIQNSVAKNTTGTELAYFLSVSKSLGLNPFNKEIWCYKDNKNNLLIFTGRDGFLSKAQENPAFNGIRSCEVCENDEYEINIPEGLIHHKITDYNNRGPIVLGYAIVFRKDGEPTIEIAGFNTYNKGYNVWKTDPASMIKKVAETHALKKAFGISGLNSEYDFEIKNNVAIPIDHSENENDLDKKKLEITELLDEYKGKDKEKIKQECINAVNKKKFTAKFADDIIKKIKK